MRQEALAGCLCLVRELRSRAWRPRASITGIAEAASLRRAIARLSRPDGANLLKPTRASGWKPHIQLRAGGPGLWLSLPA